MTSSTLFVLLLSGILAVSQSDRFAWLSVAPSQLPSGCSLAVLPSSGPREIADKVGAGRGTREPSAPEGRVSALPGLPIDTNPWTGTDRTIVAAIRGRVDPPQVVPDGPPLGRRASAAFRQNLADGVESAYVAIYATEDRREVAVYAVQFESEASFEAASARTARRAVYADAAKRTLVHVIDYGSTCAGAVHTHVRTVGSR